MLRRGILKRDITVEVGKELLYVSLRLDQAHIPQAPRTRSSQLCSKRE